MSRLSDCGYQPDRTSASYAGYVTHCYAGKSAFVLKGSPTPWTISLGTGLSYLVDHGAADQAASEVVRGYPSGTAPDSPVGHGTGTSQRGERRASTVRSGPVLRRCGPDLLPGGHAWPGRPASRVEPARPTGPGPFSWFRPGMIGQILHDMSRDPRCYGN